MFLPSRWLTKAPTIPTYATRNSGGPLARKTYYGVTTSRTKERRITANDYRVRWDSSSAFAMREREFGAPRDAAMFYATLTPIQRTVRTTKVPSSRAATTGGGRITRDGNKTAAIQCFTSEYV